MKKNSFLVSIIMPVYNMADKLEHSIDSLVNQDYDNLEIILVDDGSTDASLSICQSYAKADDRIKIIHTKNRGSGPARNTGINNSSGEYILFPDADDILSRHAITTLVKATDNKKNDLVVFGYESVNPSGKVVLRKTYKASCQPGDTIRNSYSSYLISSAEWGIQGAPWNKFFMADIIRREKIEYPSLRRHQDEAFISRYMCHVRRVKFIPDVLYTHYTNSLKKEWQKYPKDYINSVIGLYEDRKRTILTWNKSDTKSAEIVTNSYVANIIKALELSFSPKFTFSTRERYKWISENLERSKIQDTRPSNDLNKYHMTVHRLAKMKKNKTIYILLAIKVFLEKNNILNIFREK